MSDFLSNLKNVVDNGEFNSDAAKKINEIFELSNEKKDAAASIDKRISESGMKEALSEEEIKEVDTNLSKFNNELEFMDSIYNQIKAVVNYEDVILSGIADMVEFISELEEKYVDELKADVKNQAIKDLNDKILELKKKYSIFVSE